MKTLKTKLFLAFFISGFFLFGLAGVSEAAILFYEDFEDELAYEADWHISASGDGTQGLTTEYIRSGAKAYKFSMTNNDGSTIREELSLWNYFDTGNNNFEIGREYWIGFSMLFGPGYKSPVLSTWAVHHQYHGVPDPLARCSSPPEPYRNPLLFINIKNDAWRIGGLWDSRACTPALGNYEGQYAYSPGSYTTGEWIDFVIHVKWSYGPDGVVELWKDGEVWMDRTGPNCFNDIKGPYMKIGIYTPLDLGQTQTIYYDELKIGNASSSYAEVSPGGATDDTDPIVVSFTASPTIVNTDDTITFSYRVTDEDETALGQVELYRTTDKSGSPDPDNWSWIKTDDTISGTSALGSFTDSISIAGIYWYGMHVVDEAGNRGYELSPVKVTVNSEITGTSYFVKPASEGGNDGNTGLSDAQAWATITKVNSHSFQTGDNVFFKCGGTWKQQTLTVDWSGTADNRVVVGAYYGDGVIGVSGNRPIIDGDHKAPGPLPCVDPITGKNDGCYTGLIHIEKQNYINVENLIIKNSEGYGLKIGRSNNCNAYNVKTDNTWRGGIHFDRCNADGDSSIVEGCEVVEHGRDWPEYCLEHPINSGSRCTWPGGLVGTSTKNMTIRKNIVREGHGEGIYFGNLWSDNGENALIEDNIVYDIRAISIYTHNAGDIVIRRNLVYGTGNPTHCNRFVHDGVGFAGPGIYVCDEDWPAGYHMDNIKIYDNLVAFTQAGVHIGNSRNSFSNSVVYNNIFVDNYKSLAIAGSSASNSFIKNNIFWCISDDCAIYNGPNSFSGIEFSNNLWSSNPPDGIKGPNDIYSLPQLSKTSGWRSLTAGSLTGSEFTLQSTSSAINKGANLGAPYNQGLNSASTWVNNISTLNQNDYGNWEIGAFVYADVPIPDPEPEPEPELPTCASQLGICCLSSTEFCQGGSSVSSSDCPNVCCVGGSCVAPTCQNQGYKCCVSCYAGPHSGYNSNCSGQVCCEVCYADVDPSSFINLDIKNPIEASDFTELIENTIMWILSIVSSLALLILIFGGVMYIGSAGDEQKVLTAKKIVTYAIIGLILILLSYSIIMVLSGILT